MKEVVKLGGLLGSSEQRDAVHVALLPAVTDSILRPGDLVGIKAVVRQGDTTDVYVDLVHNCRPDGKAIGIVDPFLTQKVFRGHRFYVLLMPNTITSLRHEWTHPDLDGEKK